MNATVKQSTLMEHKVEELIINNEGTIFFTQHGKNCHANKSRTVKMNNWLMRGIGVTPGELCLTMIREG